MSRISNFLQEENVITKEEKTWSNGRDFAEQKDFHQLLALFTHFWPVSSSNKPEELWRKAKKGARAISISLFSVWSFPPGRWVWMDPIQWNKVYILLLMIIYICNIHTVPICHFGYIVFLVILCVCLHACILPPPFEFLGASTAFQRFQNNSFSGLLAISYRTDISSVNWDMTCHQKAVQKYLSTTRVSLSTWIPWYIFYFQSLCIWSQSGKKVNYSLLSQSVH